MRIGVLGGGLQGCCTALALADRGLHVVLFDQNEALLTRAAIANEGKIHLGYMYAADPTLLTAKTMMAGAFAFAPFFERYLGQSAQALSTSTPTIYVVHRDSQHDVEAVTSYLHAVHALVADYARNHNARYFGTVIAESLRPCSRAELETAFNAESALAAFESPELAIDPVALAVHLRAAIAAHPKIEVRCRRRVISAAGRPQSVEVVTDGPDGRASDCFDHVVNALWDGRLALDETVGLRTTKRWLHRLKYGISFRLPTGAAALPSATIVSGPFGELVSYPDGRIYVTWYPSCLRAISTAIAPPDWPTYPDEPVRSQVLRGTLRALADVIPALGELDPDALPETCVKGGVIVAWGETDIYDPRSGLHRRYEIGITSMDRFHSLDPGKLTMAPYFAEQCANRISLG
jgi:glycine/D-amino acid oxidase-like deaminating enzyme